MKKYFDYIRDSLYQQYFPLQAIHQTILVTIYSTICFFTPFFIGEPQALVGTIVNALLITAALELKGKQLIPIIILPSLGALARGIVFGPFTPFLALMIPFIWVGNTIIVISFKIIVIKLKQWFATALFFGAALKAFFLYSIAFLFYNNHVLPAIFLTTMGAFQLATALLGGVIAYCFYKARAGEKIMKWLKKQFF